MEYFTKDLELVCFELGSLGKLLSNDEFIYYLVEGFIIAQLIIIALIFYLILRK